MPRTLAARAEALLARHWWQAQPTAWALRLQPLAWMYGALLLHRMKHTGQQTRTTSPAAANAQPVPVVVVGNLVVGGAGKTPVVIALVQGLQALGWRPGVISRGYGRRAGRTDDEALAVRADATAAEVGDEPLLIFRRTGVPVWVGRQRAGAARALCRAHPEVDVIVSDDGLQHAALARSIEVLVFDERGIGNGLLLPAGPLRQPLPARVLPHMRVLHSGGGPAPLQPATELDRRLGTAWPLAAWWQGDGSQQRALEALRGRRWLALAGLATPEKFFTMLEAAGLEIDRLPQADHAAYPRAPWPAGTQGVITTEKDAVKLPVHLVGSTCVWVVGLDLMLPVAWVQDLSQQLRYLPPMNSAPPHP